MNRRDFLKVGGLVSSILLIQTNSLGSLSILPVEAEANGKIYRGAPYGKILVSSNAGKTWNLHSNFGSQIQIANLTADRSGQVCARLDFKGHDIHLKLMENGTGWRTA